MRLYLYFYSFVYGMFGVKYFTCIYRRFPSSSKSAGSVRMRNLKNK